MYGSTLGKRVYASPNYRPYFKKPRYSKSITAAVSSRAKYSTKGPSSSGTLTQQVKSLQRIVRQLQPELKGVDIDIDASAISVANGAVVHCTAIAQGDGQGNRTANLINVRKLDFGLKVVRSASYAFSPGTAYFRWAVVIDKEQVTDTSPVALSAFEYPASPHIDFPQILNNERFRYLYVSQCYDLALMNIANVSGVATTANYSTVMKFHWDGENKVGYNGSATADIEKNGIYVVYMTSGTSDSLNVTGKARVQFTDV